MTYEEFRELVPEILKEGTSISDLKRLANMDGLVAIIERVPENFFGEEVDRLNAFIIVLKSHTPSELHAIAMVRGNNGKFCLSDSADQDSAMKERYSPVASKALREYREIHKKFIVELVVGFHKAKVPRHSWLPQH